MNRDTPPPAASDRRTYFFLSYAAGGPMWDGGGAATGGADPAEADPDPVRGFFNDLSAAVARRANQPDITSVGFYDQNIPVGTDRTKALARAVGTADVLVPLYSPRYLKRSWPKLELQWFRTRLTDAGVLDPDCHIVPVLWTPLRPGRTPDLDREVDLARALGEDSPEYLEKGMRALLLTEPRGDAYLRIMDRLAQRIVDCAESGDVLPRTTITVAEDQGVPDEDVRFVIAVLAPSRQDPPRGGGHRYGAQVVDWHPFDAHPELTIAQHASDVAARLGLSARTGEVAQVLPLLAERPAIVLVDPWILKVHGGRELVNAVANLPPWVMPLVVVDDSDPRHAAEADDLTAEVINLLETQEDGPSVRVVRRMEGFVDVMPHMITRARARYLRMGNFDLPDDPPATPRMSLRFDPPTPPTGENR
jgi:FxsC-like protein